MKLSAVIFDLDGTILENEDEYGRAFNEVLKSLGVDATKPVPHERGIGVTENWILYKKNFSLNTPKTPEILAKETQDAYIKMLDGVTIRPGFNDFVEGLKKKGIKIALATSNTREVARLVLDKLGLQGNFDEITTAEEVFLRKPNPDLFTVTADKLGVEGNECLVVEDSASGVTAAHRAGMKVVAITDGGEDKPTEADLVINGFSEITQKQIDLL
jgi:HAD superfamily hydrolase (TIGR01509 family)